MIRIIVTAAFSALVGAGCMQSVPPPAPPKKPPAQAQQQPKKPKSILKRTTQDIGKYDPDAGLELSDGKVKITNPITGALEAYGPIVEQYTKSVVNRQILSFEILNNHFPTYEEFMTQIVKQYNVRLPVLPGKLKYQYDEAKHELVVVKIPEDADPPDGKDAPKNDGEK